MRRRLLQLLSLALLTGLTATIGFGQITTPPVVDGDPTDAIWSSALPMDLLRVNTGTGIEDEADFSATIRTLWDADAIYVLLEVMDDTLITDLNNPWERDHYSIYFDFGNLKTTTMVVDEVAPMDSVQFMLEKIWSVEGDLALEDSTLVWDVDFVEAVDSGTMYVLEMAIPMADIGVTLAPDMVIGFDSKVGDNDGVGLDGKLSLYQSMDEGWRNPSYLGTVTLMANGTIMGTPEVPPVDVTFNVDMTGMIDAEVFDPAVDFVDLAGTMNGWGDPLLQAADDDEDGIYTIVVSEQEIGAALEFKFRVNGQWDPISEFPGGGPNRTYTVVEGENVVNVVFNDGDYTPWIDDAVELNKASNIHIYPNPAVSSLNIQNVEDIHTIELVNLLGQVTYKQINSGNSTVVMPLEGQASGVYMIRFTDAANEISYKKLVIK